MVRGLAAAAVLVYHVRYRFFVDFSEADGGLATTGWYTLTSFGHDAVMVFFVLSGFLIGSSVLRGAGSGTWRPGSYLLSRGTRLLVVLVPGLLLTAVWDAAGMWSFGSSAIYSGAAQPYTNDYFDVAARTDPWTFLGNLAFVQTILVPPFGSNDALWSLAYELWYYLLFPLLVMGLWFGKGPAVRLGSLVLAIAAWTFVGTGIRWYFPVWLLGVGVSLLPTFRMASGLQRVASVFVGVAFAAVVASTHTSLVRGWLGNSLYLADLTTAVSFSIWMYVLLQDARPVTRGFYGGAAAFLSGCSFTLYVVHLPVLVFLRALTDAGQPWQVTPATLAAAAMITAVTLGYAALVARITEARTSAVKRRVTNWLTASRERPAVVAAATLDTGRPSTD